MGCVWVYGPTVMVVTPWKSDPRKICCTASSVSRSMELVAFRRISPCHLNDIEGWDSDSPRPRLGSWFFVVRLEQSRRVVSAQHSDLMNQPISPHRFFIWLRTYFDHLLRSPHQGTRPCWTSHDPSNKPVSEIARSPHRSLRWSDRYWISEFLQTIVDLEG